MEDNKSPGNDFILKECSINIEKVLKKIAVVIIRRPVSKGDYLYM